MSIGIKALLALGFTRCKVKSSTSTTFIDFSFKLAVPAGGGRLEAWKSILFLITPNIGEYEDNQSVKCWSY